MILVSLASWTAAAGAASAEDPVTALYHPTVLGAHNTMGQEAWYSANALAKRFRYESANNLPIYPQRPGEKDCVHYMQTRTCKFGDSCKFDHPIWVPEGGIPDWKELAPGLVSLFHLSSSPFQRFGFASSASPETSEKGHGSNSENNGDAKVSSQAASEQSDVADQTKESDSDEDLSVDDLVKLVAEKEELLKQKHKEIEKMQDKVLRSYAKMENVMDKTRREAENSKKISIQNFAKSLLDVADNLGRASSVVKESFSKIDTSKDSSGAAPLLKTLLVGVEMTEKQLVEGTYC
ncbi:grpE protein homolog 2, mitochondrial-like [Humulus lupulus]|uniref:grpE protein homolog 2, mitochondrial-like n=1 Tax=Humulus lupulus TaxID=3486 RepID=UPI002B418069|nr:grpE protein homolog 2, mitochondrial-like [Humulus lupulus]